MEKYIKLNKTIKRNRMGRKKRIFILGLGIVILAAIPFAYWFPKTKTNQMTADFNKNGIAENYKCHLGKFECYEGDKIFAKMEKVQYVQDFEIADIDGDGSPNLILQVVNLRDFGRHIPFWHEKRKKGMFSHIYIYEYKKNEFRELWCSSAMVRPAVCIEIVKFEQIRRNWNYKPEIGLKIKDRQRLFIPAIKDLISGKDLYQENIWIWEDWGIEICETI